MRPRAKKYTIEEPDVSPFDFDLPGYKGYRYKPAYPHRWGPQTEAFNEWLATHLPAVASKVSCEVTHNNFHRFWEIAMKPKGEPKPQPREWRQTAESVRIALVESGHPASAEDIGLRTEGTFVPWATIWIRQERDT